MNIGDIYAQTLLAASSAADLILVSPDTYTGFTPDDGSNSESDIGFVFHIVSDEVITLQSDITDHYVETNTARQDHIALKPKKFTVSGYIGEQNDVVTSSALQTAKKVLNKLNVMSYYTPELTIAAQRAYNLASQSYSLFEKVVTAYQVANGVTVQTKQEKAYSDLEKYWNQRMLFFVATPFGQFSDMAIESLTATQSENSKHIADFSITFKQVRFTSSQVTTTGTRLDEENSANKGNQVVA